MVALGPDAATLRYYTSSKEPRASLVRRVKKGDSNVVLNSVGVEAWNHCYAEFITAGLKYNSIFLR